MMEMRECRLFYLLDDSRKNDTFDFPYSVIVLYGSCETRGGGYYTYFGYGDVPSGRVSIFTTLV